MVNRRRLNSCMGTITLIGAGELMPAMSKVHREALAHVVPPVSAVYLDTPAGYESNADAIAAKAVEYYAHRLQTSLRVASYRHSARATEADAAKAVAEVRTSNFLFAGPGSPTYALEHWRGSPVWAAVVERFRSGAHMLAASAASITMGAFALPVYEIYKAGRDPYWEKGLDLLGEMGLCLAVVPHFDDNSGGSNWDSRFCYIGAARFDELQAQLPPEVVIFGLDEYTAARFDAGSRTVSISGQGSATVIADGRKSVYPAGSVIPMEALSSSSRVVVHAEALGQYGYEFADIESPEETADSLAEYLAKLPLDANQRVEVLALLQSEMRKAAKEHPEIDEQALVDLALELRSALRAAQLWQLSDQARDTLIRLGYEVQDTPEGTVWHRR